MKKLIVMLLLTVTCFSMANAQWWRPFLYATVNSVRKMDAQVQSIQSISRKAALSRNLLALNRLHLHRSLSVSFHTEWINGIKLTMY